VNPAFSVIFLTTLIGAGQGLFLALFGAELMGQIEQPGVRAFVVIGSGIAFGLTALGLFASFFHLGHPLRAWRSATMWRTSWLAREVIALPLFMAGVCVWGGAYALGYFPALWLGTGVALLCLALFVCTAMVYASVRFLREWASPLTLINYTLLGCASGFTLATGLAAVQAPELVRPYAIGACALTLVALASRVLSLRRNALLRPKSTLQTALGIKHPTIRQKAQGFMGGSFNTREFFHGRSAAALRGVKWGFLTLAFVLPVLCLVAALSVASVASVSLLTAAFAVQYVGLLGERWFFLAQANHPQNLYYQAIS
jgi:sulfite dehydrogenase (quinone) subunit SoeC